MLIAIAGSQGSGKSTVVTALKDAGYDTIERKTSRSILSDWGVSLDEVNGDNELTAKFQDEITTRKWADELDAISSDKAIFTERSHMDLFTYALISIGKNNEYANWLNEYYKTCHAYSQACTHVFYLPTGCFPVEADGVRGENIHYSDMVNDLMFKYTARAFPDKFTVVRDCTVDDRVNSIINNNKY